MYGCGTKCGTGSERNQTGVPNLGNLDVTQHPSSKVLIRKPAILEPNHSAGNFSTAISGG